MFPISIGLTGPPRCQICMGVPGLVGFGALSRPSWHQIGKNPIAIHFSTFFCWNQWPCWGETGQLRHKHVWASQESDQRKSFSHAYGETPLQVVGMIMLSGYDFSQGWSTEEGCDDSTSDAHWLFELITPDFSISTTQLFRSMTAYDFHFLFATPRIGRPQWLTGLHQTYQPLCQYAFCVVPIDGANVVT